jgi:hypothetical protein
VAGTVSKILVVSLLLSLTVAAYGGSFRGWFLPEPLKQPVSLRDGSPAARSHGNWVYWVGGRSHYGGGYRGGK